MKEAAVGQAVRLLFCLRRDINQRFLWLFEGTEVRHGLSELQGRNFGRRQVLRELRHGAGGRLATITRNRTVDVLG
jgi:hypothetical protein